MLYQLHEYQRAVMNPVTEWAHSMSRLFANTSSPLSFTPGANRIVAGLELMYRLGKDYEKPEWGIRSVQAKGHEVPIFEQTVLRKPFCNLIRFKRFSDDPDVIKEMRKDPVVLVVAPLSGHHATLLRDTVRTLLQDHKVYVTDWVDARMVPVADGVFHLNDYVEYVREFLTLLGPEVHVISVCQPTVPVMAAVSLMATDKDPHSPRSMIVMGGPIDARQNPTKVNNLAMTKPYSWFENNVIFRVPSNFPGAGRLVYPGFLQHTGFVAMNPDRHFKAHYDYYLDLLRGDEDDVESHRKFYDEYNAVLDMDAGYYLDTIKTVFQDFSLPKGTWEVHGKLVRPQDIKKTALMCIEGELDDISGLGQTKAALEMCSGISKDKKEYYQAVGAGHYGIFSGSRWRNIVYPEIRRFILDNHDNTIVSKEHSLVSVD
ncbi:polyhydroxyalkanoate depolymerase [Ampullimonas aquatilis]|uniref:polyhydroxyalkanoate depolymerase n=1 Tax=Ampullimonas aquatilis TaxID=1341549 RepID=UPI003C717FD7